VQVQIHTDAGVIGSGFKMIDKCYAPAVISKLTDDVLKKYRIAWRGFAAGSGAGRGVWRRFPVPAIISATAFTLFC